MRILSVTAQKPDSTGSGVFLTELVKGFEKAGHQQAVICGSVKEDEIHLPASVAVYPVYYQSPSLPFPVCGMSDEMPYTSTRYCDMDETMTQQLFAAFRQQIETAVAEFQPDVILCHHLYFLCALLRECCPNIPLFGQCHGSDLRQFRKNPWQHDFILQQIPKLNGILALHEEQKQQICETYGVPESLVHVSGTAYNSDVFAIQPQIKEAKAQKGPQPQPCRLIFAGKLSEKKGVMSLLRSLSYLEQPQNYSLDLAGGYGNQQEYDTICSLAQAAPCPVTFLGKLNQQQLAQELNAGDVFVLPSFFEGLPLVLIEAMACGLRVICTDLPGIRPWLDKALPQHGVLFVEPPAMENQDEPLPASLPAFEQRLAAAIASVMEQPLPNAEKLQSVSWTALCQRLCQLFSA